MELRYILGMACVCVCNTTCIDKHTFSNNTCLIYVPIEFNVFIRCWAYVKVP